MGSSNFRFNIILRIAGLLITIFLLVHLYNGSEPLFIQIIVFGLLAYQVANLLKYIQRSNYEMWSFLNSIKYDDVNNTFTSDTMDPSMEHLQAEFQKAIKHFQEIRKEKEADFQYLKNIVQHIGIGIITFNKVSGEIQIFNTASKRLLKVKHVENVSELKPISEELVNMFFRLKTGGRDLIRIVIGEEIVQLAVYAIELNLKGEEFKLISLQNIQSELEEKEMEAWQNLVRVLTHEIMNSITPISSLAETVRSELASQIEKKEPIKSDDAEDLHSAIQTIQKRSKGLIRFIQDFRNLTQVQNPKFKLTRIKDIFSDIQTLMKNELEENDIQLSPEIETDSMAINVDKQMIEQVLINLVKNAIQAFDEDCHNKSIKLKASFADKGRPVIMVKDNGSGIDDEALQKIFIPFYTTKKGGSGIGLSLSRQIMRLHQGSLGVKSAMNEGTEFYLRF